MSDLLVRRINLIKFQVCNIPTIGAVLGPHQATQHGRVTRGRQRYLLLSVRPCARKIAPCDVTGAKKLLTPRSARLQVLFARPRLASDVASADLMPMARRRGEKDGGCRQQG